MKQIDAYVDSVYQNVGGKRKEINELKEEMKGHLIEAVYELQEEGKTKQEAIDIAIERFGGEKEMRSILGQLFQAQKTFAKWLLYSGLVILTITALLFGVSNHIGNENISEQSEIAYQIGSKVASLKELSTIEQEKIQATVNSTNYISNVKVYKTTNLNKSGNLNNEIPDYEYERNLIGFKSLLLNKNYYASNGSWVSMDFADYRLLSFIILFVGFTTYWVTFLIWAIINAYHHRRLNIGWIIIFSLFNVLGYLMYSIFGKRRNESLLVEEVNN